MISKSEMKALTVDGEEQAKYDVQEGKSKGIWAKLMQIKIGVVPLPLYVTLAPLSLLHQFTIHCHQI